jgi:nicotinamide-nucleotide amidase
MQFNSLKQDIIHFFKDKSALISCAESCTGGMVASALTDLPGSSAIFDRGFVTYSNSAKIDMLGVDEETLKSFGAVSEEVAQEMAKGALDRSQASLAVSITGIAGPGGSDSKPEGRVCFGLALKNGSITAQTRDFGAVGRSNVREASCKFALEIIIAAGSKL